MDTYTLFPYWFTLVLLLVNAMAVRYIRMDIEEENDPNQQHD